MQYLAGTPSSLAMCLWYLEPLWTKMLHFSVVSCFGCLSTHWGECGQLVAEEELVFDGDGGLVVKVDDGEEDVVGGRGEEVSVAIDVVGSEMLEGEGGDFDN